MRRCFQACTAGWFFTVLVLGCTTAPDPEAHAARAVEAPDWARDIEAVYPESDFLAFVASGAGEAAAKQAALAELAGYFGMTVTAETEASVSFASTGDEGLTREDQRLVQAVQTQAAGELVGVEYSTVHHRSDGLVEVVAYINRQQVGSRVASLLSAAESELSSGLQAIRDADTTTLQALGTALRIEEIAQSAQKLRDFLSLLSPDIEASVQHGPTEAELRAAVLQAKDAFPVAIRSSGPSPAVAASLSDSFTAAGIRIVGSDSQSVSATVLVDVAFQEIDSASDFKTVEWRMLADLSTVDGASIAAKQLSRRASGSSSQAARARAEQELLQIAVPDFTEAALSGIVAQSL